MKVDEADRRLERAPCVSVVIGTYNAERYLPETLDSLFTQTFQDFEAIVADDASTDRTVEIAQSYGPRVRILRRATNSGLCQFTRNMGIRAARGRYVAFLDHDDAWYPTKLEKQVAFMESHPEVALSHTYCHIMDGDSRIVGVRHEGLLPPTGNIFRDLLRHCWITISSVMARRAIFEEVGLFREEPDFLHEDYEFFLRVAARYPIGLLDEVLVKYRKSSFGITTRHWRSLPEAVPLNDWLCDQPGLWSGLVERREVIEAFLTNAIENSVFWRDRGFYGRAAWFAWRMIRRAPADARGWRELMKALGKAALARGKPRPLVEGAER